MEGFLLSPTALDEEDHFAALVSPLSIKSGRKVKIDFSAATANITPQAKGKEKVVVFEDIDEGSARKR